MIPLVALLAAAAALATVTLATARRPAAPVPDVGGYLARWSPLHGDYDPRRNAFLLGWLRLSYALARPLARRGVLPDVLTLWGLWLAFAVYVPARAGGRWALAAGLVLVASGLADTLDGCVAVLTERTTRWGYVLDSVVDRACDVVYLFAVVAVGGRADLALAAGLAFWFLEYLRARAGNAGMARVEVVTVGERATRVICCALGLVVAGLLPARAALAADLALGVLALLSAAGVAQLLVAVRRTLTRA
jgi:CDP-diacylglycerol--glycerol-3-phosphate 3-phosphatidyltransferase